MQTKSNLSALRPQLSSSRHTASAVSSTPRDGHVAAGCRAARSSRGGKPPRRRSPAQADDDPRHKPPASYSPPVRLLRWPAVIPTPADAVLDLDRAAFGPLKEGAPPSSIVGLYLLFDDGRLITSLATGNEAVDSDILASMLIAVSDFVKDSFPAEGLLSSLDYSDCMILLEWGQRTILAALIRGRPDGELRQELTATLHSIEELYHDVLTDWDGDLDLLAGARGHLEPLMRRHANGSAHREGTYQVTLSGESLPRFYELLLAAHPHAEEPDAR